MKLINVIFLVLVSRVCAADVFCPDPDEKDWPKKTKFSKTDLSCEKVALDSTVDSEATKTDLKKKQTVDLNGDGICEYIIPITSDSGSGGTVFDLVQFKNNSFERIGRFQSWGISPREKINGWYSLYTGDISGQELITSLYAFKGGKYQVTKKKIYQCES